MRRTYRFLKSTFVLSFTLTTFILTFVPDSFFAQGVIQVDLSNDTIVACNKLLYLLSIAIVIGVCKLIYLKFLRKSVTINGNGYNIVVEYGDLFEKNECKKVIGFDECFTTNVGTAPADIKPNSICGQFLRKYPNVDFTALVEQSNITPCRKHSAYNGFKCYPSGSIIPFNDYLLLAFAKLDKDGLGRMTRDEFLQCLDLMWREINKHYCNQSVAIPVLGSGITRLGDETLTHQQLLDMIIASYKLSAHKLKQPAELHIVCRKDCSISLNKIGEYI